MEAKKITKVAICGKSGLVGSKLEEYFKSKNYDVIGVKVRDNTTIEEISKQLQNQDIVINLSGTSILGRWSKSYKEKLYNSRIDTTNKLVEAISILEEKPQLFITASAVGIYNSTQKHDDNSTEYNDDFLSYVCKDWESSAREVENYGVRSVQTRFGVIYAKDGGAMQKMLPPFRMGVGGKLSNGEQMVSWIHIDDLLGAFEHIVQTPYIKGSVNFTTPSPLSNTLQTEIMGRVLKRPTFFTVPAFMIKLIFGEGSSVMLDSKEVYPTKLLESGFTFKYPHFEDAFKSII